MARSLIASLPEKTRLLGPVAGVSYSVASRIAVALKAGKAVADAAELSSCRAVLFHAPADQAGTLLRVLEDAPIKWQGKPLLVVESGSEDGPRRTDFAGLEAKGAAVAEVKNFGLPGILTIQGREPAAITAAHRFVRELKLRAIEILPGQEDAFGAAITLAGGALTPLIDAAGQLLKAAGARESDASHLAAALFQKTASEFDHSGRQSWLWYKHPPEADEMERQIMAAGALGPLLRELLLNGLRGFEKHPELAAALRQREAGAQARVMTVAPRPPASSGASE